jgi:transposase-like protein
VDYCCPGGLKPLTIITDADLAAAVAIRSHFPEALHLRCSWHLCQNVLKHATKHCANDLVAEVVGRFKRSMYATSRAQCEAEWTHLMQVRDFLCIFSLN